MTKALANSLEWIDPNTTPAETHYAKVLGQEIHPDVQKFFSLSPSDVAQIFAQNHPSCDQSKLLQILTTPCSDLTWAGADLLHVTKNDGSSGLVLIELNSCPSGIKSMPFAKGTDPLQRYRQVLQSSPLHQTPLSKPAVFFDKNPLENRAYAHALADLTQKRVAFIQQHSVGSPSFVNGQLQIPGTTQTADGVFRYLTQKPWMTIPYKTQTAVVNPISACLAGGRNKLVAEQAYLKFEAAHQAAGFKIERPATAINVELQNIPAQIQKWGGRAAIKNPYSNAGLGVWTIADESELKKFMTQKQAYQKFILQELVVPKSWQTPQTRLMHFGTQPNSKGEQFAFDLRLLVTSSKQGFAPLSLCARHAAESLSSHSTQEGSSWSMLGTNLTFKNSSGEFDTDPSRLLIASQKEFPLLQLSLNDLVEAYVLTVFATLAIDNVAAQITRSDGTLDQTLFATLDPDPSLLQEIRA